MAAATSKGRRALLFAAPVLAQGGAQVGAQAGAPVGTQGWAPARPLRLIVPFPPGGTTDMLARLTAERLGSALGQPVVIDNRPGAAGTVAADIAAKSEPDGLTLFFASIGTAATNRFVYPTLPDPNEGLADVAGLFALSNVAVVSPARPWRGLADFIAAAQAAPGSLTYGSSGAGSSLHLTGALLAHMAAIDILHVPYRGAGQMLTELVAGRIDAAFPNLSSGLQLIRDGSLRALATTGRSRSDAVPGVATFAETVPRFVADVWYGLQAPRGTPAPVVARLNAACRDFLADPGVRGRLAPLGIDTMGGAAIDFTRYIATETARWRQLIRDARITAD